MSWPADRNFDDLAHRFKRNVYDRLKGDIRLEVLHRDLREHLPELYAEPLIQPLRILDAGGGQGQFSLELAAAGHHLVLCDLSENMLQLARDNAAQLGVTERVSFYHGSIQDFARQSASSQRFDLVLCHAVLEWVSSPASLLDTLQTLVRPQGHLSLTFYNVNGSVLKNLLRANFQKVVADDYRGYRGSLTPTYPRDPQKVYRWLQQRFFTQLCRSGIRCFHDYILDPELRDQQPETQLALELRLSREEPWLSLGRYIHVLSQSQ